jgi:hypothetical protein
MCNYWLSHVFSENEDIWIAYYLKKFYGMIIHRMCYQENSCLVGGYKEKAIYDMMFGNRSFSISFEKEDIELLRKSSINILYGAGNIGFEVFELLKTYNIPVHYVAVSDKEGNADFMNGVAVKEIDELLECKDGVVILGTDEKWHGEIIATLKKFGFYKYIKPNRK